jgi:PAS domain S-box-containing protein
MVDTAIRAFRDRLPKTDLVRIWVIVALAASCTVITALAFSRSLDFLSYQLFYIPVIYAAYVYAKRGVIVSGLCGILFETVGFYYAYPDTAMLTLITLQAVVFIIVASVFASLIDRIRSGEARYRSLFEHSQLGIVLFDKPGYSIRQTNAKFLELLHYPYHEISGKDFTGFFFTARDKERFLERFEKEPDTSNFETRFVTKEGDGCWVNLSWSRVDDLTVSCTAVDINSRKFAEKANNDNMMKYRQLTEHSPTGILIIEQGSIRYANPSFITFSGHPLSSLLGKNLGSLIVPGEQKEFTEFAKSWDTKSPGSRHAEFHFPATDGSMRVAALFTTPIMHFSKPATLINVIDNSEQQRLTEKIEQDNIRRKGIITTVAHELRTPLQPILGYLNLLVQDPEGFGIIAETKKILERCLVSVDRERRIINQMLDLSVLESGKLTLSYSTFPLAPLVRSVIDAGGYPGKAEITLDIPEDLEITADRDRIFGTLESLFANAVNFSKPPRVISVACRSAAGDPLYHIAIRDNGIGIAESSLASIFEPFQLADSSKLSRTFDRIGLSLSIAKKIIQMHGGDITVESAVNGGSTFTIHLPREVTL